MGWRDVNISGVDVADSVARAGIRRVMYPHWNVRADALSSRPYPAAKSASTSASVSRTI